MVSIQDLAVGVAINPHFEFKLHPTNLITR
jgi:hypothetical protein